MNKKIKLHGSVGSYVEGKEQLRLDEDFEFELQTDISETMYFVANNGKETIKGLVKDREFTLPRHFIKVGELSVKIEQIKDNRVARTFIVEDLQIIELDGAIYSVPEIESLRVKINQYSKLVDNLEVQVKMLTKLVAGLYNTEIKVGNEQ